MKIIEQSKKKKNKNRGIPWNNIYNLKFYIQMYMKYNYLLIY